MNENILYTLNRDPMRQMRHCVIVTRQDQLDMAWLVQAASEGCAARGELNFRPRTERTKPHLRSLAVVLNTSQAAHMPVGMHIQSPEMAIPFQVQ